MLYVVYCFSIVFTGWHIVEKYLKHNYYSEMIEIR